jgi:hypothetical protein
MFCARAVSEVSAELEQPDHGLLRPGACWLRGCSASQLSLALPSCSQADSVKRLRRKHIVSLRSRQAFTFQGGGLTRAEAPSLR